MRFLALLLLALTALPATASPAAAVDAALIDCRKLSKDQAERTLYLSLDNLEGDEREELLQVLDGWVHHISREAGIEKPRRVASGMLVAVNREDYGWLKKTQDALRAEPVFHRWERRYFAGDHREAAGYYRYRADPVGVNAQHLRELEERTGSRAPLIRADFFLFYSSRQVNLRNKNDHGFGYLDWLQLKDRGDVEKLAGLQRKTSIRLGKELRAILEEGRSGVVQLDRQIEWYANYGDDGFGTWLTLDTFDNGDGNTGQANLERGAFRHQAEEWVFGLPNNHVGMWLGDQLGVKQDTAPDKLGGNRNPLAVGTDTRIHVGLCFQCHTDGFLKDIDDWARRTFKTPSQLEEKDYQKLQALKRQYFGDLRAKIKDGRERYRKALLASCGLTSERFAQLHAKHYYRYQYGDRRPASLAVELGTTPEQLAGSLKRFFDVNNKRADAAERRRLLGLKALIDEEPSSLPVTNFEQFFQDLQIILRDYP